MGIHRPTGNHLKAAALAAGALAITTITAFSAGAPAAAQVSPPPVPVKGVIESSATISANSIWAVGVRAGRQRRPILAHWNGSTWTLISSPALPANGDLHAITAFKGGLWAVGSAGDISAHKAGQHLILRITGTTVTRMTLPGPATGGLVSVTADSAKDAWAGGFVTTHGPFLLHWNGTRWTRSPIPADKGSFSIAKVSADSPRDAFAIETEAGHQAVFRWNGHAWKRSAIPAIGSAGHTFLNDVAAISGKDAWIVGSSQDRTLILHWNGTTWARVASPSPKLHGIFRDSLDSISVVSASNITAIGRRGRNSLAEHWDGHSWKVVPAPPVIF
ncbi:MAG TPA: hypothetical protein VFQ44_07860 [Streptosporangiaceae bacterium]|nr:hypothetical protein [Streptosporangiaceae bacterium]